MFDVEQVKRQIKAAGKTGEFDLAGCVKVRRHEGGFHVRTASSGRFAPTLDEAAHEAINFALCEAERKT